MITKVFTCARNKVEGPNRGIPCSKEKLKRWSTKKYWEMKLRLAKGKEADKYILENKKLHGEIIDETDNINEIT